MTTMNISSDEFNFYIAAITVNLLVLAMGLFAILIDKIENKNNEAYNKPITK